MVVDDEPYTVGSFATMLEDSYAVRSATSGGEALDRLDEDVDVVLLDRQMPDLSGDSVLHTIRQADLDCSVAMISAIRPDTDIRDMEFDAYLVKPVRQREVRETVESLLYRGSYSAKVRELYSLTSRIVALEKNLDEETLTANDEYQELVARRETVKASIENIGEVLDDPDDPKVLFQDVLGELSEQ